MGEFLRLRALKTLKDGWIELADDGQLVLQHDFHQDCTLVSVENGPTISYKFRRNFLTCDPRDYYVEVGEGLSNQVFSPAPRTSLLQLERESLGSLQIVPLFMTCVTTSFCKLIWLVGLPRRKV